MVNSFGGYETKILQMALNRNQHKYTIDVIDRIDGIIQGQKFRDQIKKIQERKLKLKNIIKQELLKDPTSQEAYYDFIDTNKILKVMIKILTPDDLKLDPYHYYISEIFLYLRRIEYDSYPSDFYNKSKDLLLYKFNIILYRLGLITIYMIDSNFYEHCMDDEILNYFYDIPRILATDIEIYF